MENYETNFNVLMPIIFAIFCHEYGLFVHINDLQNFKLNLYTPIVCKMQKAKPETICPLLPGLVLLVSLEARRHTHTHTKNIQILSLVSLGKHGAGLLSGKPFSLHFLSLFHTEIIGKPQKPNCIDQKRYLNLKIPRTIRATLMN